MKQIILTKTATKEVDTAKKTIKRKRAGPSNDKVNDEKRIQLIELVSNHDMKMSEAAYRLGINVSTAKSIIYKFRETGQITKTVNFGDTVKTAGKVRKLRLEEKAVSQAAVQEDRPMIEDLKAKNISADRRSSLNPEDQLPKTFLSLMEHINSQEDKQTATPDSPSQHSSVKPAGNLVEKLIRVVQKLSETQNSDTLALNELAEFDRLNGQKSETKSVTRAFVEIDNIQNLGSESEQALDSAVPTVEKLAVVQEAPPAEDYLKNLAAKLPVVDLSMKECNKIQPVVDEACQDYLTLKQDQQVSNDEQLTSADKVVTKTLVDVMDSIQELLSIYDNKMKNLNEHRDQAPHLAVISQSLSILPNACKAAQEDTQLSNPTTTTGDNKTALEPQLPANFLSKAKLLERCEASRQIRQQLIQEAQKPSFDECEADIVTVVGEPLQSSAQFKIDFQPYKSSVVTDSFTNVSKILSTIYQLQASLARSFPHQKPKAVISVNTQTVPDEESPAARFAAAISEYTKTARQDSV